MAIASTPFNKLTSFSNISATCLGSLFGRPQSNNACTGRVYAGRQAGRHTPVQLPQILIIARTLDLFIALQICLMRYLWY